MQLKYSENRKAFVTGGASGFGLETVKELLNIGAQVTIADINQETLDSAHEELNVEICLVDVSDKESLTSAIDSAAKKMDGLDTLVNSAGVIETKKLEDISEKEWDWIMDINAKGTFLAIQAAMPYLKKNKNGRVVNLSSTGGINGFPLIVPYCASKFAVTGMTQSISEEVAPYGVTVNAVCPSSIPGTRMGEKVVAQKVELYKEMGFSKGNSETILKEGVSYFPSGRFGTVEEVVSVIMYLISENASWITGESINIDGGSLGG